MPRAKRPTRVAVRLDRASSAAVDIFKGVLDFGRARGWVLVDDAERSAVDGIITDDCCPAEWAMPAVTVSTTWMGRGDVRLDSAIAHNLVGQHFTERGYRAWSMGSETTTDRPRGSACFVESDAAGVTLIRSLMAAGRDVPGDVAVLAIGNDLLTCERCDVPLSSIDPNARAIGRRAAARLWRLLRQQPVDDADYVLPAGVVTRASTDALAIDDPDVAAAVRFIRSHAFGPLRVGEILRAVALDRRTLERRFAKALGRSPIAVLRQHRTHRAAELLRTSDRTVTEIATACGFKLPQHLAASFKQIYGQTPTDYRRLSAGTVETTDP